jgi:hypothetical protein
MALCREAFHGLGVQDVAEFDSDCCSVFCLLGEERKEKEKKKKEKWLVEGFFPRAGRPDHALLSVPGGIFAAGRCK